MGGVSQLQEGVGQTPPHYPCMQLFHWRNNCYEVEKRRRLIAIIESA
jgi:hypothetical protein